MYTDDEPYVVLMRTAGRRRYYWSEPLAKFSNFAPINMHQVDLLMTCGDHWQALRVVADLCRVAEIKRLRAVARTKADMVLHRDGYRCVACGSGDRLEIDHIVPVSRGGSSRDTNLQTLCRVCNAIKRDLMPWEWRPDLYAEPSPA